MIYYTVDEAYIVYWRVVITEIWVSKMLALTVLHAKEKNVLHAKNAKYSGAAPSWLMTSGVRKHPPAS